MFCVMIEGIEEMARIRSSLRFAQVNRQVIESEYAALKTSITD